MMTMLPSVDEYSSYFDLIMLTIILMIIRLLLLLLFLLRLLLLLLLLLLLAHWQLPASRKCKHERSSSTLLGACKV